MSLGIDPGSIGASLPPLEAIWTSSDCLLYALAVGAGATELQYTTENTQGVAQQVVPTFAVIPGGSYGREAVELAGKLDWTRAVDAGHTLELRQAVPVTGRVLSTRRIAELWDKGSAAIVVVESVSVDAETGVEMFVNRTSMFFPGHGGFGGSRGPAGSRVSPPFGEPAASVVYRTRDDQALLYRLTGDRYPIHSDPAYARAAGFDRPILHGLCTYGFAARALIATFASSDPTLLRTMGARFSAPAFPGDELHIRMWDVEDGATFRVERADGAVVIDQGRATFGPPAGRSLPGGSESVSERSVGAR